MRIEIDFVLTDGTAVSDTATSVQELDNLLERVAVKLKTLGLDLNTCDDVFDGKVRNFRIWYEA